MLYREPYLCGHHPGGVHGHRLGPVRPIPGPHAVAARVELRRLSPVAAAVKAAVAAAAVEWSASVWPPVPRVGPVAVVTPPTAVLPALCPLCGRLWRPCAASALLCVGSESIQPTISSWPEASSDDSHNTPQYGFAEP